jgi:hypothetical protein
MTDPLKPTPDERILGIYLCDAQPGEDDVAVVPGWRCARGRMA